jgi:5'-nucleotidase/UDP-sugar diphosphatase
VDGIRKEVAAQGGSVLLLSGGDINTGVPESDLQDAEPDFRGMNLIGYDAMAVGNHEFDNPLSVLRQQEKWANSRSSPPTFTRKAPANACSNRGRCLSVRI